MGLRFFTFTFYGKNHQALNPAGLLFFNLVLKEII